MSDPMGTWQREATIKELRAENDAMRAIIVSPAALLNHLLDTRGVEPAFHRQWGDLPGSIDIPADLARAVFGAPNGDGRSDDDT